MASALGRYLAFLDDDDLWLPGHLERAREMFARYPGAALVGCDVGFGAPWAHRLHVDGAGHLPTEDLPAGH